MFVLQILLFTQFSLAATELPVQQEIDRAFGAILSTPIGKAICRDILGANPQALEQHLGVSPPKAETLARECAGFEASEWIYPTTPSDIRKLSLKADKPRRYKVVRIDETFPIESWTDSVTNVTTILIHSDKINFPRLVQILAHETAVYFDSKSHPLHAGAQEIPHLRGLNLKTEGQLDPLIAASNPLQAHTLTYLRALQIEFAIVRELVARGLIAAPADLEDPYLNLLISDRCQETCIGDLIVNTRKIYQPFNFPLIAYSAHFRQTALQEFPQLKPRWTQAQLTAAYDALLNRPVQFMRDGQTSGDTLADMSRFFFKDTRQLSAYREIDDFLNDVLWPLEWASLSQSRFANGVSLLSFLKRPLLSGYNISLASGPRVRVRPGELE